MILCIEIILKEPDLNYEPNELYDMLNVDFIFVIKQSNYLSFMILIYWLHCLRLDFMFVMRL